MNSAEILERIKSFERWHYQIELAGHKTPIFQANHINRHEQRKRYFFDPLVELFGGSLEGKRVLDLGCNAGYWSLCAVESGCDYVLGIDGRQMHINQAEFVFDVKGIEKERYAFLRGNVLDLLGEDIGEFDVVLCLGLIYHTSKPVTLIERTAAINSDLLVVDTLLSKMQESAFEITHESLDEPRHSIDYELVLVPTRTAMMDLVSQFGYRAVVLKPDFTDYTGAADYRNGYRRAFVCSKRTGLATLGGESRLPGMAKSMSKRSNHLDLMQVPARGLFSALVKKVRRRLSAGCGRN